MTLDFRVLQTGDEYILDRVADGVFDFAIR